MYFLNAERNTISEDIIIEKAKPEDAEELLHILKIIGGETDNLTFGSEGLSATLKEEQIYLASLIDSASSAMFVARKNGRIVGNAHFCTKVGMGAGNREQSYGSCHRFCQKYRSCGDHLIRS